jgi:hypothetical protein
MASMSRERDLTWDNMVRVADRMTRRYADSGLVTRARRQRSIVSWTTTDGLQTVDNWTNVFEPVRRRRFFGRVWSEVQPLQEAASKVGTFLRERPDLKR